MDCFERLANRFDELAHRAEMIGKNTKRSPCRDVKAQQAIKAAVYRDCAREIRIEIELQASKAVAHDVVKGMARDPGGSSPA